MFAMNIPLISNENYHLHHQIPLPIPINNDSLVIIAPETDYLVISIIFSVIKE